MITQDKPRLHPSQDPLLPEGTRVHVISDGKAGDELQCIGVAQALGAPFTVGRVHPRRPWAWLAPRGPVDPKEAPDEPGSPIARPFSDILIASGRRAIPYLRHVRKASNGRCFTVILKDPRTGPGSADLIWAPAHDRIKAGENVIKTLTSPHGVTQARLAAARAEPPPWADALARPRVAVLVGGDSRHHRFTPEDVARLVRQLGELAASGASLMGSRSRRTPQVLADELSHLFSAVGGWWWDGEGENPYIALLAHADALVVTADSVNMIGEATATGRPVLVFEPKGGHRKIGKFLDALAAISIVHHFAGRLEGEAYPPLDSTHEIATAIARRFMLHAARHPS
jgi:uncharacterized protein